MKSTKTEHVLVCLSASPSNAKTVLAAVRMAQEYKAELTALYVETPEHGKLDETQREQLATNVALARKSGAHIATTYGSSVAAQIAYYAKTARITRIVIGRPNTFRRWDFYKQDIIGRLMQFAPEVEIFIIPNNAPPYTPLKRKLIISGFSIKSLFVALVLFIAATLLGFLFNSWGFTESNIMTIYILSVLFTAFLTDGQIYGVVFSIASVVTFNFLFTEPRFTLHAYERGYPLTFLIMFISSILTSSLTAKAKTQSQANAQKAYQTEVLLSASQNFQGAKGFEEILTEAARQLDKLLGKPVIAAEVLKDKIQLPVLVINNREKGEVPHEHNPGIMTWVLENQKAAGAGTDHFPDSSFSYYCVWGRDTIHAIIGIGEQGDGYYDAFERNLVMALLSECGSALEKQRLLDQENALILAAQQEKLRSNLLRAISHDLRTPLTSISGNADMLLSKKIFLDEKQHTELYTSIYDDSVWLIDLVENLLSITRMDDGVLNINMRPEIVGDVIDEAVSHIGVRSRGYTVTVNENDELLMANMDARLIMQVLINLIDNAIKYTQKGTTIVITTQRIKEVIYISVADNGEGISCEAKARVFDMFYSGGNGRSDARRGLGLGLALCKTIITAHGGDIRVEDNEPSGTIFTFTLAAKEAVLNE